jgi:undecaprenyl diphosphate synthase
MMLRQIYEHLLKKDIANSSVPKCVAIVLNPEDLDDRGLEIVIRLIDWAENLGIRNIILYSADDEPKTRQRIVSALNDINAEIKLHTKNGIENLGHGGRIKLLISLGFGGKHEVAQAIKKLLKDVESGKISPQGIDEKTIEANLRFDQKPDLLIRAGGKKLSDFMIWQAAYSELYFTEVNWKSLRKIDFLRAIRDYQQRERRFGR